MYRASTTTSTPFSESRSRTRDSCSAFVSFVTGRWWNGTPWDLTRGARSGWLETTSGISASSSPASQRQSRSVRQWSYLETRTAILFGVSVWLTCQSMPWRRARGLKAPANSSRARPKPSPSISRRIKNVPPSETYWSAERMLPSCIEINEERAEIRPFLSGHETVRRRLEVKILFAVPDLGDGRVEEEVEKPVGGDTGPALRALELVQVGRPPEEGGNEAAELDVHYLVDGEVAAYLYELPNGLVVEWPHPPPVDAGQDVPRHDLALLHGGLGVGRHRGSVLLDGRGAVAHTPDVLVALDAHEGVRLEALALVCGKGEVVQLLARPGACRPDGVLRRDLVPVREDDAV